ncbi:MAG: YihA family ribosome biogenesis GTP-binding protein [Desulfovibrionaceae bacterium]|nr:YihA family ribosome biogenesis GTP-binding protein [Desulfovibrionaceae bacterium]MBF0515192.1 YihA family ribosome biogenesis GTP-binding protein [Desulfovibrionaceae bacterium]
MKSEFVLESTLYTKKQLDQVPSGPQIVLTGRSNVGKSSLINCLAGRKGLAKTSSTPGKTQSVNFYRVLPQDYYLADLPGYGYAKVSKEMRRGFGELIEKYLRGNARIKAAGALIDIRLPPQESDLATVEFLSGLSIPLIPILTKADKCTQRERALQQSKWRDILCGVTPVVFSAKTGLGRDQLLAAMCRAALGEDCLASAPETSPKVAAAGSDPAESDAV